MPELEDVCARLSDLLGVELDAGDYTAFVAKVVKTSEGIGERSEKAHGTHIAITGDRMAAFPVVTGTRYLTNRDSKDKRQYTLRLTGRAHQHNLVEMLKRSIDDDQTDWRRSADERRALLAELEAIGETWIPADAELRFGPRPRQLQIEVHNVNDDDAVSEDAFSVHTISGGAFSWLRSALKEDDWLVWLIKAPGSVDVLGVPGELLGDDPLPDLHLPEGNHVIALTDPGTRGPATRAPSAAADEVAVFAWRRLDADARAALQEAPTVTWDAEGLDEALGASPARAWLAVEGSPATVAELPFAPSGDAIALTLPDALLARVRTPRHAAAGEDVDSVLFLAITTGDKRYVGLLDDEAVARQDARVRDAVASGPSGIERFA